MGKLRPNKENPGIENLSHQVSKLQQSFEIGFDRVLGFERNQNQNTGR
jgi:hypothetical protein